MGSRLVTIRDGWLELYVFDDHHKIDYSNLGQPEDTLEIQGCKFYEVDRNIYGRVTNSYILQVSNGGKTFVIEAWSELDHDGWVTKLDELGGELMGYLAADLIYKTSEGGPPEGVKEGWVYVTAFDKTNCYYMIVRGNKENKMELKNKDKEP